MFSPHLVPKHIRYSLRSISDVSSSFAGRFPTPVEWTHLKALKYSVDPNGVACIYLDRSKKKNAFNFDMYTELQNTLNKLSDNEKAII